MNSSSCRITWAPAQYDVLGTDILWTSELISTYVVSGAPWCEAVALGWSLDWKKAQ